MLSSNALSATNTMDNLQTTFIWEIRKILQHMFLIKRIHVLKNKIILLLFSKIKLKNNKKLENSLFYATQ